MLNEINVIIDSVDKISSLKFEIPGWKGKINFNGKFQLSKIKIGI